MKFEKCFKAVKPLIVAGIVISSFIFLGSCSKDDDETELIGNWVKVSDFEGVPRADAVAFTISDRAYLGTGYDGKDRLNDFWEYDPDKDFWQQKADFPGLARNGAVGFGIGTKGYLGTGYSGYEKLDDFWEYNPETNSWTQKDTFAGSARYGAVGFAINNSGYIGTGYDGYTLKDFWKYDPENDEWSQIVSIGGSKRRDAIGFVIEDIAYVGTGVNNGVYISDFWAYDPVTASWTEKNDITNTTDDVFDDDYNMIGINGVGFAMNLKGYIATSSAGSVSTEIWEYDPVSDLWEKKTSFEGSSRTEAVAFTINERAYVTTGRNSSYYFDDIWEFRADEEYEEND